MLACMNVILTYRGRSVTEADVAFLRQLIADNRRSTGGSIPGSLQSWGWRQPNGVLKDAICRSLMLQLHRAGHIELPPPLARHTNRGSRRWHIATVSIDCRPLRAALRDLPPLSFRQVRRTPQEPLFNALLHQHHELGYRQPVGEHLKYLVYAGQWLVAALAWSSAAHGLTCRDQFIGWSLEARRRNRHLLAYNTRFLVPPWVQVPHLASHVLGRMARRLPADCSRSTVIGLFPGNVRGPARHRGTCYRAANWIALGQTFGRGHRCPTSRPNRPPKLVLGYPLVKRFRELLAEEGLESMEVWQHEG